MAISHLAKEGLRVFNENHGFGTLFARSLADDEVFLVRFQHGLSFVHRKNLTEIEE